MKNIIHQIWAVIVAVATGGIAISAYAFLGPAAESALTSN